MLREMSLTLASVNLLREAKAGNAPCDLHSITFARGCSLVRRRHRFVSGILLYRRLGRRSGVVDHSYYESVLPLN
jgi:hypothetical protein